MITRQAQAGERPAGPQHLRRADVPRRHRLGAAEHARPGPPGAGPDRAGAEHRRAGRRLAATPSPPRSTASGRACIGQANQVVQGRPHLRRGDLRQPGLRPDHRRVRRRRRRQRHPGAAGDPPGVRRRGHPGGHHRARGVRRSRRRGKDLFAVVAEHRRARGRPDAARRATWPTSTTCIERDDDGGGRHRHPVGADGRRRRR